MNALELVTAFGLPPAARINKRVSKEMLAKNAQATAADTRRINEGIEELLWLAALKPSAIGVPEYRDAERAYEEIAVVSLTLRPEAKTERLVELVHRAIPYPAVLVTGQGAALSLSFAHKRRSQNDARRAVLEGEPVSVALGGGTLPDEQAARFLDALAIERQPAVSLHALYQGWIDVAIALQRAALTGQFAVAPTAEQATVCREALHEYSRLDTEIAALRAAAAHEKQLARQVELNLEIKRLTAARDAALAKL